MDNKNTNMQDKTKSGDEREKEQAAKRREVYESMNSMHKSIMAKTQSKEV